MFCQVNFWFLLSVLAEKKIQFFAVHPIVNTEIDRWKGFGQVDQLSLHASFRNAVEITSNDLILAGKLFNSFAENDFPGLKQLSLQPSEIFRKLQEVIDAHISLQTGKLNEELISLQSTGKNFDDIFRDFSNKFGMFGFGDLQLKLILKNFKS